MGLDIFLHWCSSCWFWILLLPSQTKWCSPCVGSFTSTLLLLFVQMLSCIWLFFLIQDSILSIDDCCLHFHHCHFYYWKSGWEERNSVNRSSAPSWRHQHSVLGVSILLVTRIVHSHTCLLINLSAYSSKGGIAFIIH